MIAVASNPGTVTSGSTVCILVTGCTTVPTVSASIGYIDLPTRITGADGAYMICVTVPRGETGRLYFRIYSGNDHQVARVAVI